MAGENNLDFMVFETYDLGEKRTVSRACNIIDLSSDGSYVRMIVSDAYGCGKEEMMFYPQSLFKQVIDSAGYLPQIANGIGNDPVSVRHFHLPNWRYHRKWQGEAINALTEQNNYDVVFSYLHNIDALSHNFLMYCKNHPNFLADKNVFKALWRKFTKILTYISGS